MNVHVLFVNKVGMSGGHNYGRPRSELSLPPAMAAALTEITGDPAWRPTFAFRMGYAPRARLSPRRGLHDVLTA